MIELSDNFGYKKLIKFTMASIFMVVFSSIYGVVDGFFVSNFAGKEAFTAVNFIVPFLYILASLGFMFGSGSSALIAKTMGEGDNKKSNEIFSLIIFISIALGILITIIGYIIVEPVALALGAKGELFYSSVYYAKIIMLALPAWFLQFEFQYLFITAEKPKLGFYFTLAAGITNMILDGIFVGVLGLGIGGAAVATGISQCVGGLLPFFYFSKKNSSKLRLVKPKFDLKAITKTCTNGISELLGNISMCVVNMLYNVQLLKYAGEDGVAAYGVLMFIGWIFISIFIGYSVGSAPIIAYHYGAKNYDELKGLKEKSLRIIGIFSILMFVLGELFAVPLSKMFFAYDPVLLEMTIHGFRIFSLIFLICGFSIFGSSFFTALNDGLVSGTISFMRTLVFQTMAVMILPMIWGLEGIWYSNLVAEALSLIVTIVFFIIMKKKYHY